MASTFHLEIVTPKGIYKDTEVSILNVVTPLGQTGILAHHTPLASGVEIAEMNYVENGQRQFFAVGGGFLYVGEDKVTLIANTCESAEEIDLRRAEEAKARAEKRLSEKNSDMDVMRAEIALKKAITRIGVKRRY